MGEDYERAWVAVGDQPNWERGLENGIWGIVPGLERHWQKLQAGDLVFFYCVAPVGKFFGAGIVRSKFRQTSPLWKEEIEANGVIWPYRFEFDPIGLIAIDRWHKEGVPNRLFNLAIQAGLSPIADLTKAMRLMEMLNIRARSEVLKRKALADRIFEIGQIQRMVVESAYPVDNYSLDVVWKRTIRSVPTFAFAVNVKEKIEDCIQPLKRAHDLWNSRPFLITDISQADRVRETSSSLYHEFSSSLKILTAAEIEDLYRAKKKYFSLEERYGLR